MVSSNYMSSLVRICIFDWHFFHLNPIFFICLLWNLLLKENVLPSKWLEEVLKPMITFFFTNRKIVKCVPTTHLSKSSKSITVCWCQNAHSLFHAKAAVHLGILYSSLCFLFTPSLLLSSPHLCFPQFPFVACFKRNNNELFLTSSSHFSITLLTITYPSK